LSTLLFPHINPSTTKPPNLLRFFALRSHAKLTASAKGMRAQQRAPKWRTNFSSRPQLLSALALLSRALQKKGSMASDNNKSTLVENENGPKTTKSELVFGRAQKLVSESGIESG